MYGTIRQDVRQIIIKLCKMKNVQLIEGAVCADHVHLFVAIPPKLSVSSFMEGIVPVKSVIEKIEHCESTILFEYPKLVMVRDPLHDNVWFKSAGDLSIFKVKYGRLWSYTHLPARVAGQRNRHRISPGHGKHMD